MGDRFFVGEFCLKNQIDFSKSSYATKTFMAPAAKKGNLEIEKRFIISTREKKSFCDGVGANFQLRCVQYESIR